MSDSTKFNGKFEIGDGADFQRASSSAHPSAYVVKDGIMTAIEADAIGIILHNGQVVLLPLSEWQRLASRTGAAQ